MPSPSTAMLPPFDKGGSRGREVMEKVLQLAKQFARDEEGVTAIEYGLIAALIAVVIIAAVSLVGNNLRDVFNFIAGKLVTTP